MVFPEGTPNRNYCIRDSTAGVIFVALYIGAVAGNDTHLQPKAIYRMTEQQSHLTSVADREGYRDAVRKPKFQPPGVRWYEDNSREQLRDESLREGLVQVGAIDLQAGVAVTSSKPRYSLTTSFAALFDPSLTGTALDAAIDAWQKTNLSTGALARIALALQGATTSKNKILVTFPNGETRHLSPGLSSVITKAVIEEFAPRFLQAPAVVTVSESGNKVVARDDKVAKAIGLTIQADTDLPDVILADIGPAHPLLVFIEVVHSDGPISDRRREALTKVATDAGFPEAHLRFVTAYKDRGAKEYRRTVSQIAWGSFVWFATEPNDLVQMTQTAKPLALI